MTLPGHIAGLSATLDRFDAYFLDQFGVLHDGRTFYDGVVHALNHLHNAGKTLIVLTNSGKRAGPNLARLVEMGISPGVIHAVVSSGEVAWHGISGGHLGPPFHAGGKAFLVGRDHDDYGLNELNLQWAQSPEDADFILILGSNAPKTSLEDYARLLSSTASRAIPALCANPDKWMLSNGQLLFAPGAIADIYQSLGGKVTFIGKPYAIIYQHALTLCEGISKTRILAVGDSVEHDIRGACDFGIASALVRTGVLAAWADDELDRLYEREQATPDYLFTQFRW